jgi:hypothetical protein
MVMLFRLYGKKKLNNSIPTLSEVVKNINLRVFYRLSRKQSTVCIDVLTVL